MANRILLVEDEFDIRDALQMTLQDVNFEVLLAGNGKEGLDMALAEHPDLILLDLKMPVMDGQEMLRQLRMDDWGKDAKVIILTSSESVGHIQNARELGALDYIIKSSVGVDEVLKVVQALVD